MQQRQSKALSGLMPEAAGAGAEFVGAPHAKFASAQDETTATPARTGGRGAFREGGDGPGQRDRSAPRALQLSPVHDVTPRARALPTRPRAPDTRTDEDEFATRVL